MSYHINLSIDNRIGTSLTVVEKCVWEGTAGGEWSEKDGKHILSLGYYGAGLLRFKEDNGRFFHVVVGSGERGYWVDVQVELSQTDTGVKLLPEYYRHGGKFSNIPSEHDVHRYTSRNISVAVEMHGIEATLCYS